MDAIRTETVSDSLTFVSAVPVRYFRNFISMLCLYRFRLHISYLPAHLIFYLNLYFFWMFDEQTIILQLEDHEKRERR